MSDMIQVENIPASVSTTGERYVAFLDIQGFSAALSRPGFGDFLANYGAALERILKPLSVDYVVFSDSVVLTTPGKTTSHLEAIVRACSYIIYELLGLKPWPVAVKGAIARGDCTVHRGQFGTVVAGRPIVEAYKMEQIQDWIGVILCPSVIQSVPDLPERLAPVGQGSDLWDDVKEKFPLALSLCRARVPFKDHKDDYDGYAVVPVEQDSTPLDWVQSGHKEIRRRLSRLYAESPDPTVQQRYYRALEWIGKVRTWIDLVKGPLGKVQTTSWALLKEMLKIPRP